VPTDLGRKACAFHDVCKHSRLSLQLVGPAVLKYTNDMTPCLLPVTFPADVTVELEDIVDAVNVSRTIVNPWATILRRRYRPQLVISILIPTFQQWVGINAIIFYAPREL
jgi:hypothetical protein